MLPAFASNFIPERNVLSYLRKRITDRKRNIAGVICIRDSRRFTVIVPILLNMHILQSSQ